MSYIKIGHVYILESSNGSSVKIGRSRTPKKRLATLVTQANAGGRSWVSPVQDDCFLLEKSAHLLFEQKREYGEWFKIGYSEAIEGVLKLLAETPSHEDIERKRLSYDIETNKRLDNFSGKLKTLIPPQDKEWEKSLMLADIASELFSMSMLQISFFNKIVELGGLSKFELSFAFVVYGKDNFFIACLLSDCAEALNFENVNDMISFIDKEILQNAVLISKEFERALFEEAAT